MHQQQQHRRMVQLSKEMSKLLRHSPPAGAMDAQASLLSQTL
jgi:RNA:NAD 2'-phosphotransferase (TPT1/KptA family)